MYLRDLQGELTGGAGGRSFGRAVAAPASFNWAPNLRAAPGSRSWWRGLASCAALVALAWGLAPGLRPLAGAVPPPLAGEERDDAAALAIAPLGAGAATGRRMAPTEAAAPVAYAPERPRIELSATIGGDGLPAALARAGVSAGEAGEAARLVEAAAGPLAPGVRLDLTLGPRSGRAVPRPLEQLSLRARFDLALTVARDGGRLTLSRRSIPVTDAPWRIEGLVGSSLYRSIRAAGASADAATDYLRAIAARTPLGNVSPTDRFDLVIERERAGTGEVRIGRLLLAGLAGADRATRVVRWDDDWVDADGRTTRQGFMGLPVDGRITSPFGWRVHPILGFLRLHKGLDIAAPEGTPVHAALDGTVRGAGWAGGYGNFVRLEHGGGIATGYGHLSRYAVAPGMRVVRGQVIGWVGTTGLSTGPHLHWEVWRNGESVDPRSISYDSVAALPEGEMARFRALTARLDAVRPGG